MAHPLLQLLKPVSSTSIEAYQHFKLGNEPGASWKTLFVAFKSGNIYRYFVPEDVCLAMDSATSFGAFVNQMKVRYPGIEVPVPDAANIIQRVAPKKARRNARKQSMAFPQLNWFF